MNYNLQKAIFAAKKNMAGLVYNFTTLEGMNFTLPEVQTYIQGVSIGGHKLSDTKKLEQQALAWKRLITMVEEGRFVFDKKTACELQGILAKDEALEWGVFRNSHVSVAGRDKPLPLASSLDDLFEQLCMRLDSIKDIKEKGFIASLDFANNQYFFDGNKRTGFLMMNGIFISNGVMPFCIAAKDLLLYNQTMLRYYNTGDESEMLSFYNSAYEREYGG